MSGHSKWSTIKRAKGAADAKRGAVFGKLSKKITIAAREGGGDAAHNFKLRLAIDKAKEASMPSDNIDRAIKKGTGESGGAMLEEITYEGYGPGGAALLIETATDNKNRTVQAVKHILGKHSGSLGSQGSVAWQFKSQGQIIIERIGNDLESLELAAIDAGASDIITSPEGIIIHTAPDDLEQTKQALKEAGAFIMESELVKMSTQQILLGEPERGQLEALITALEDIDDVINIYTNAS